MGAAVGIDLGTTNTVVAAVRDGRAVTLADEEGRRLIPSIVTFHPDGSVLVGAGAKDRRLVDPAHTIYSVKRLIGRGWDSEEVQRARTHFPFELRAGEKNDTRVAARGETYALPEISAFVLRRAKAVAEAALGEAVERAVITVPANFNDLQRAATKMAGKLAGLDVLRILNEPTAAALAYGQSGAQSERLAVYDLGGGTFDITLLDLSGNVFEVLATAGDTALGGDDIDVLIAKRMAAEVLRAHRFDPRVDPGEMARLRIHAERLKQELTASEEASITVKDIARGDGGAPLSLAFRITRKDLERDLAPILERTFDVCRSAIATASLAPSAFDRVILVGGPTRMPIVKRRVEEFFQKPAAARVNPDEVVALGAAIQAHVLDRGRRRTATPAAAASVSKTATARGVAPPPPIAASARRDAADPGAQKGPPQAHPAHRARAPSRPDVPDLDVPGLDTPRASTQPAELPRGARPLAFEETPALPAARPRIEPYARFAPPEGDAPDSASVARRHERGGAGTQEAQVEAPVTPLAAPLLIDVTPLSLRVETVGGFCDLLIAANTAVPCDRTRVFLTATDGQTTVAVRVAQGESNRFADNTYLGELELSGITAAARGETSIGVTFEIDADGILNVKARDAKSGHETRARLALFGAQNEPKDVAAMMDRQAERAVV